MIKNKKLWLLFFFCAVGGIFFYSCDKNSQQPVGVVKRATLVEEVRHHQWTIPGIPVYIKKDAIEFPGKDTSSYDYSRTTNIAGTVQFDGLVYGNYYLFVHGWDPTFHDSVIGYKPVVIGASTAGGGLVDDIIYVSE